MAIICAQCGSAFTDLGACGPTHAAISAGIHAVKSALGNGREGTAANQIRWGVDPDDVAIVEAAKLMAAGRKAEFVITLREGRIESIATRDGGPL